MAGDIDHACAWCYSHRLEGAARYAAEHGFSAFTSTLLASTYQDHKGIAAAAEHWATVYGVKFLYRDFRPNFRSGNQRARELGFYMQKYWRVRVLRTGPLPEADRPGPGAVPARGGGPAVGLKSLPSRKTVNRPRAAYGRAGLYLRSVRTCGYPPGPRMKTAAPPAMTSMAMGGTVDISPWGMVMLW